MAVDNGNTIKAAFEAELPDGTLAQNVFYFICNFDAQQTNTDVMDAVEAYCEEIYVALAALIPSTVTLNPIEIDKIAWDAGEGIWKVTLQLGNRTPTVTFTGAGDIAPNQIAPVLRANTPRPKSFGRKFMIGFIEGAMNGSSLETAAVTALATSLAHYLADETVSGTSVLSPGVPRSGVNTFLEFTDGVVNSIVGTQRRRKPGVGG